MEQEFNAPYKSNYTLGIVFTILSLVAAAGNIISYFIGLGACISSLASTTAFILLMVWFYRSHKNLPVFNSMGLKYSPGWAVGSFFVPVLNLFRPYQIAQEIWTASDPEASTVSWKQSKIGIVIVFWWLSLLAYYFVNISTMGYAVSLGIQSAMNGVEIQNSQLVAVTVPILVTYLLYTILSISLVNLVNDRQDEKAEALGIL